MAEGDREKERGDAGRQRQGGEYCKIQYLGNDACADSCVQNVTGNAIRCGQRIKQDAMRCDVPRNFHDFSIKQLMSQYFTMHNVTKDNVFQIFDSADFKRLKFIVTSAV